MKKLIAVISIFSLVGCAGGTPPSSGDDIAQYDVIVGMKEVPKSADTSRVWSPLHMILGEKPGWSIVWFKQRPRGGNDYPLTARAKTIGKTATNTSQASPQPR